MYDACMATKTISIEIDSYELLKREKRDERESFSQVIRRLFSERPVLTAGELAEVLKSLEGKGAGKRRNKRRVAA
jgi:predicted CopG family antitoxin